MESPKHIQIETTALCNAACPYCPQKKSSRKGSMPLNLIHKIVDETKGLGITYIPYVLNEPFTDSRMPEICKYIKNDPTAKTELNTNGSLLTPAVSDDLSGQIDILRFSIDPERGLNEDLIYRNVAYFHKVKKQAYVEIRKILLPNTDRESFLRKWSPLADKIVFTELYKYPSEYSLGTGCSDKPCLKPQSEMYICVNGNMTLCVWDTYEENVIGNVRNEHVLTLWEKGRIYRNMLKEGKRKIIPLCNRCMAFEELV